MIQYGRKRDAYKTLKLIIACILFTEHGLKMFFEESFQVLCVHLQFSTTVPTLLRKTAWIITWIC